MYDMIWINECEGTVVISGNNSKLSHIRNNNNNNFSYHNLIIYKIYIGWISKSKIY